MSRRAAATPRWPPLVAASRSSASTTSRPCSSGRAAEPMPRASPPISSTATRRHLPFDDGSFDVVSSVFGAMFAPDQERTASELVRVVRPGGRIGLVAHTPEGFIGQLFKTNAKHVPPPAGLRSPILWGTEHRLRRALRRGHRRNPVRAAPLRVPGSRPRPRSSSTGDATTGPILKTFDAVGDVGADALETDLLELIARYNQADRRHDGRAERVPRGRHRHALTHLTHHAPGSAIPPRGVFVPWRPEGHGRASLVELLAAPHRFAAREARAPTRSLGTRARRPRLGVG